MPTTPDGPAYTPEPGAAPEPEDSSADLGRIAWSVTTLAFAIGALVLLTRRDYGYASVAFAVAAAAGINLL